MLLSELLGGVDVLGRVGDGDVEITSVAIDSRRCSPGSLFACVPGEHTDGHLHAAQAVRAGARALLVERYCDVAVPQVKVASARLALGPVSAACYGHPSRSLAVHGITGTNGKTTATYLLEAVLRAAGEVPGVLGTVECRIDGAPLASAHTTPEAPDLQRLLADMRRAGVTAVAMEASSHALAQHRLDGTRFAAVCFTNLTHDHLDYHGTLDAYFEAKASLFSPAFSAAAACNLDDPRGVLLARRASDQGLSVLGYGLGRAGAPGPAGAAVRARDVALLPGGSTFLLEAEPPAVPAPRTAPVASPLLGRHNVSNALAAAATALAGGTSFDAVVAGLHAPVVVPGRMERVDGAPGFTVFVDYAHTPDALEVALHTGRELVRATGGRLVAVFGCGGDRDVSKRPVMGRLAASLADMVWVTSDNPRSEDPARIAAEIVAGIGEPGPAGPGTGHRVELDRRLAIRRALAEAGPGDVVILAGKGHESGQTAGGATVPFDDRDVAREALGDLRRRGPVAGHATPGGRR